MLSECAVCLVRDSIDVGGGFWTTATALGDGLEKRLVTNAGMTFEVIET